MKLIAGLGNPGREYERTPHNVGFDVVDLLCRRLGGDWRLTAKFNGRVAKVPFGGDALLLVQPQTFMNASGECVGPLMRYYRMEPADIVAVLDDVELPPGRLRVRSGGGDGGHLGLASLIGNLGTNAFPRVRIGVGRGSFEGQGLVGHVLGRFPADVQALLDQVLPVAADAVLHTVRRGAVEAMNKYNGFSVEAAREAAVPATGTEVACAPEETRDKPC